MIQKHQNKVSSKQRQNSFVLSLLLLIYFNAPPAGCSAQSSKVDRLTKSIIFSGSFKNGHIPDSVTVYYWNTILSVQSRLSTATKEIRVGVKKGDFQIRIDSASHLGYISLGYHNIRGVPYEYLSLYLAEAGDCIQVDIDENKSPDIYGTFLDDQDSTQCFFCNTYHFSGKGSQKYQLRTEIDESNRVLIEKMDKNDYWQSRGKVVEDFWGGEQVRLRKYESLRMQTSQLLNKHHQNISEEIKSQLKTDLMTSLAYNMLSGFVNDLAICSKNPEFKDQQIAIDAFGKNFKPQPWGSVPDYLNQSAWYGEYLLEGIRLDRLRFSDSTYTHKIISQKFTGPLRDRLLTNYLIDRDWRISTSEKKDLYEVVKRTVQSPVYILAADRVLNEQSRGTKVYNFKLEDEQGKVVQLSDFRDKVVFIDFWFEGCGNCVNYYKTVVSKVEDRYSENREVVFITIATMVNKQAWKRALESGLYTSKEAINLISMQGNSYPLMQQLNISGAPHPIVIDRNGDLFCNSLIDLWANGIAGLSSVLDAALINNTAK